MTPMMRMTVLSRRWQGCQVSLLSTGGCHERERQPTLASDTTESNSTLHICIFLYTSCHQYNAGAQRSWTISVLKKRMVESCGWRAGERESRGHKEVQVPWQPWEAPPSNYSERSESDHLTRGHLNVTSLTIWSVSKLQGQVLERGVRTVPRRLTQLIGRIRRECCKIGSNFFSHPKRCQYPVHRISSTFDLDKPTPLRFSVFVNQNN